ncbi:hypothetical protein UlMin_015946 [Ulmus minor]
MSGRNHGLPLPIKGVCDAPYGRECGLMPHPKLYKEMRESQYGMVHRPLLPPHPAIFEEQLATQHQDIQAFLVDNRRVLVTHVALKQDFECEQKKDVQMRDLYEKIVSLELDLCGVELHCIEYQKEGFAENYEHGQMMEKKLILIARELEKLHVKWPILRIEHAHLLLLGIQSVHLSANYFCFCCIFCFHGLDYYRVNIEINKYDGSVKTFPSLGLPSNCM